MHFPCLRSAPLPVAPAVFAADGLAFDGRIYPYRRGISRAGSVAPADGERHAEVVAVESRIRRYAVVRIVAVQPDVEVLPDLALRPRFELHSSPRFAEAPEVAERDVDVGPGAVVGE